MKNLKDWGTESKVLLGLVVLALIALVVYRVYKSMKDTNNLNPSKTNPDVKPGDTPKNFTDSIDINRSVKRGDSGNTVLALQNDMNYYVRQTGKYSTVIEDGFFGAGTETLLKQITGKTSMSLNAFRNGYLDLI